MAEGFLRSRRTWLIAVLVPLGAILVVVAAWAMDGLLTDDEVARGVTVGGRDVSGLGREDLEAVLSGVAVEAGRRPVTVTTPEGTLETTAGSLGVTLDVEATADDAMATGRDEPIVARPWSWVGAVLGSREAPVTYRVNRAVVALEAAEIASANTAAPAEPTIEATDDGWQVVGGHAGEVLDEEMIAAALAEELRSSGAPDDPIGLELRAEPRRPRFPDGDAEQLAADAERLTSSPLDVTVQDQTVRADPPVLRSFYEPVTTGEALCAPPPRRQGRRVAHRQLRRAPSRTRRRVVRHRPRRRAPAEPGRPGLLHGRVGPTGARGAGGGGGIGDARAEGAVARAHHRAGRGVRDRRARRLLHHQPRVLRAAGEQHPPHRRPDPRGGHPARRDVLGERIRRRTHAREGLRRGRCHLQRQLRRGRRWRRVAVRHDDLQRRLLRRPRVPRVPDAHHLHLPLPLRSRGDHLLPRPGPEDPQRQPLRDPHLAHLHRDEHHRDPLVHQVGHRRPDRPADLACGERLHARCRRSGPGSSSPPRRPSASEGLRRRPAPTRSR